MMHDKVQPVNASQARAFAEIDRTVERADDLIDRINAELAKDDAYSSWLEQARRDLIEAVDRDA